MMNCVWPRPDCSSRGGIVTPDQSSPVEQIGQGWVFKAGIHANGFIARGINHENGLVGRCGATGNAVGVEGYGRFLRRKQIAAGRGGGGSRNDELMGRKTWSLVGLKHTISKRVMFRESEIRSYIRWIHVGELGVHWYAIRNWFFTADLYQVSPIHLPV